MDCFLTLPSIVGWKLTSALQPSTFPEWGHPIKVQDTIIRTLKAPLATDQDIVIAVVMTHTPVTKDTGTPSSKKAWKCN